MKLCITEKPSVARDIAAILGASARRDGYFEGKDYWVTWTYGHLCTLKEPADYTERWKRWTLGSLPMLPERFGIKVIDQESIKRQFKVIESLISQAEEVINCGDAGQEGELIQRWVMQKAGIKCPVKRLWISSLTDESIREGFNTLQPESNFNNLYYAGLSRAIGDWILGLNATRLYSLKYSEPGKVLSIGRVQTPTLALIVQRHKEIANFVPEDFWELRTLYRDTQFAATKGRFKSEAEANAVLNRLIDKPFTVTDVTEKKGKESPPRLFDLTSLQVECNRRWGWTAERTLSLIQTLYEKKVTTYPRVDTTFLTDDIYKKIPEIFAKMTPYQPQIQPILAKGKIPKSKRVFDNSKVTDHHAIIPTGQAPNTLQGDERKLYHLIALRFIAAFYPDCTFLQTTVSGRVDDVDFRVSGKVIDDPGWRTILQPEKAEKAEASDAQGSTDAQDQRDETEGKILPHFDVGESGPHTPSLQKKTTTPPKPYTEGALLRAMETAGKTVDDEELRDAMKENGIGRPSTRAAIIETLFRRNYVYRERKNIMAAPAGIQLIDTINQELLKSAKLTGIWEHKLRQIERGNYSAAEFIAELKQQIDEIVRNVLSDNTHSRIEIVDMEAQKKEKKKERKSSAATTRPTKPKAAATTQTKPTTASAGRSAAATASRPASAGRSAAASTAKRFEDIKCPRCGQGHLLKGRTAYGCSRYAEGCGMLLPFDKYAATLTPAQLEEELNKNFQ